MELLFNLAVGLFDIVSDAWLRLTAASWLYPFKLCNPLLEMCVVAVLYGRELEVLNLTLAGIHTFAFSAFIA